MKSRFGALTTLSALLGLSYFSIPATFAETGWAVTQMSKEASLSGSLTLYVTPTGMRSMDPKSGLNMYTKGPNWTMNIFNDKTRRIFSSPLQQWLVSFKQRGMSGRFDGATWRRGREGNIAGVRAYEFVMDHPPPIKASAKQLNGKMANFAGLSSATMWVAADIVTPPQVSDLLSKMYGVPDCQRIPLRVTMTEKGKAPKIAVDTVRVAQVNVPETVFASPRGYQPVKQDSEIFIDKESMDTLDEMMKDLDSPTPSRRPTTTRPATRR